MVAFLTLTDDNPFTRAAEARPQDKLSPVLWALAKNDLSRLGRIAAFDIPGLGAYMAALLKEAGSGCTGPSALYVAEESRCLGSAAGEIPAAFFGTAGDSRAFAGIFPEKADWGTALPALAEYIRAHGAGELGLHGSFYSQAGPVSRPLGRFRQQFPLLDQGYWILHKIHTCQNQHTPSACGGLVDSRSGVSPPFRRGEGPGEPPDLIRPAANPDRIRLADLFGYEEQRSIVSANTLRFLEGKPANNLLLYGDRGTGKSATVKAVCNEYIRRGLRLLEVPKDDLSRLPAILEFLSSRALRFIIFIDDLSFETTDDSFTGFKALLEGGMEARPANVVIYATSNRRHLVKERLADRPTTAVAAEAAATGDLRAFDTMQEQFSLADRFGLTVVFASPGQEEYLKIAESIAERRGLFSVSGPGGKNRSDEAEAERRLFRENALRWERWFNGRSPRTAVQYVDWAAGGEGFPWE
jgi:predicted AAA+ superfamily ATPase